MADQTTSEYATNLRDFICRTSTDLAFVCESSADETERLFNQLALSLFALQFSNNPPYRHFCLRRSVSPESVSDWSEIPAVPASAFKELELTSLPPAERQAVFHSSGTTQQKPSRNFHNTESLEIYEASLLPWFKAHFLPDRDGWIGRGRVRSMDKLGMIFLTSPPSLAPHSSLVHMFETVRREFAASDSQFTGTVDSDGTWRLDMEKTALALRDSQGSDRPIALLGTAFNFVHLLNYLTEKGVRYQLAPGSRVLETGGYKNRSRAFPKLELHSCITRALDIPPDSIICEYGMSELSSQAYDSVVGNMPSSKFQAPNDERVLHFPPWARARIISPETGQAAVGGKTGLIRVLDLANVRSVLAIQTEDLGINRDAGFALLGRAAMAESRGCSLMSL